jgi:hypothetical protein
MGRGKLAAGEVDLLHVSGDEKGEAMLCVCTCDCEVEEKESEEGHL